MNKQEANQIINGIIKFSEDGVQENKAIQTAVNDYVMDFLKHNPNVSHSTLQRKFDKQASNLARSFQYALKIKLIELRNESLKNQQNKSTVINNEKEYLIKDVCDKLGLTSQNINHLIRTYNLPVREESARKRYLSESTVELLRTGKYK